MFAPSRSNTTSRSEFDPRSMTAMRPGGLGRLRSGTGGSYRAAAVSVARFVVRRSALPRPDRLGLVRK